MGIARAEEVVREWEWESQTDWLRPKNTKNGYDAIQILQTLRYSNPNPHLHHHQKEPYHSYLSHFFEFLPAVYSIVQAVAVQHDEQEQARVQTQSRG